MAQPASEPFDGLIPSFQRHLRAEGKAAKTVRGYTQTAYQFAQFCIDHSLPVRLVDLRREHVELYLVEQLSNWTTSTAATRFAHLQQFFNYAVEEEEIELSPMRGMRRPRLTEPTVDVVKRVDLAAVLKAAAGKSFEDRRDSAIIRMFIDTGVRMDELVTMRLESVDLEGQRALVRGKGDRHRWVVFGAKTTESVDRYLRSRRQHALSKSDRMWLGVRGPLTDSGVNQMLHRRGAQAGVENLHAHRLRHTWSHEFRLMGGSDSDLKVLGGWRSDQMLAKYGRSAAAERALLAGQRLSLGDDL